MLNQISENLQKGKAKIVKQLVQEAIVLGTDVSPEAFVTTAKEQGCLVICCSALLTTMPVLRLP